MTVTIEIKGPGGTINYPTDVIVKALKEAGLQVEVHDEYPSEDPERTISIIKERLDTGLIKDAKAIVKTTHYPWGG
jgi:hypothetical protein